NGNSSYSHDFFRWSYRNRFVFKFWLYHSSSRANWYYHCLLNWSFNCLLGDVMSWRTVSSNALYWCFPCLCQKVYRRRYWLYCRNLILVNLDDCSRFRIYSCWTYHARVVSSYPSLDLEYYFYYINILFQCLFG